MSSIYKRSGSKTWQCQYYVRDPISGENRKIRRSTGKNNVTEARVAAAEMELAARKVLSTGSIELQEANLVLDQLKVEINQGNFTIPSANRHIGTITGLMLGEKLVKHSLESWSEEWLRRKSRGREKGGDDATIKRYRAHINVFLNWLPKDGRKKPLESVTLPVVRNWKESLEDSGLAGKTVKYYLKDLGMLFRAAILEGVTTINPWSSIIAELDSDDSTSRKPFQMEEVKAMIKAAPTREWQGLILIAAFTGLRLSDAATLPWDKVDLEDGSITLIPAKTRRRNREVRIPLQENLLEFLRTESKRRLETDFHILPTLSQKPVEGSTGLSDTFTKMVMASAGVSRGKPSKERLVGEQKGKGRVVHERGFHSFRHTFSSWLRNAGVSEEDRMALTGHSTRESHRLYSHTDVETLRKAIEKLPVMGADRRTPTATPPLSDSQEIATVAAQFTEGTAEERVQRARQLVEAARKPSSPAPTFRAWHETEPLSDVLDKLLPSVGNEERLSVLISFLLYLERQELEATISSRKGDNLRFACSEPVPDISEKIIADRAGKKLKKWQEDGVMESEGVKKVFLSWAKSVRKGIQSGRPSDRITGVVGID